MTELDKIFSDILPLKPEDKLQLIDTILASIYPANHGVDKVWERESEERITAYNQGQLSSINEQDLFSKYKR